MEGSFTVEGSTAEELAAEELGSGEGTWMRAEEQDVAGEEFGVGVLVVVGTFTPTSVDCGPSQLSLSLDVFEESVGEPEHASKGQERATLYLAGDNDAGGVHASGGQHDGYRLEAPTWDEGRATIEGVRFAYVSGSDCLGVSEPDAESAASTLTVTWALDPGVVAAEEYTCPE